MPCPADQVVLSRQEANALIRANFLELRSLVVPAITLPAEHAFDRHRSDGPDWQLSWGGEALEAAHAGVGVIAGPLPGAQIPVSQQLWIEIRYHHPMILVRREEGGPPYRWRPHGRQHAAALWIEQGARVQGRFTSLLEGNEAFAYGDSVAELARAISQATVRAIGRLSRP